MTIAYLISVLVFRYAEQGINLVSSFFQVYLIYKKNKTVVQVT